MSWARRRPILILITIAALAMAALAISRSRQAAPAKKPVLLLLTSLPIAFGDTLSLDSPKSPVLEALEESYRVIPIATASIGELRQGKLLLMIQPFAQPAEDLVALDGWVRGGGRLVLLADPLLERADARPLDDLTRPPPMFLDTGLLAHWGLRLDAPETPRPARIEIGGQQVATLSPGKLTGGCNVAKDHASARCRIGKGQVEVIADADFIDSGQGRDQIKALRQLSAELRTMET